MHSIAEDWFDTLGRTQVSCLSSIHPTSLSRLPGDKRQVKINQVAGLFHHRQDQLLQTIPRIRTFAHNVSFQRNLLLTAGPGASMALEALEKRRPERSMILWCWEDERVKAEIPQKADEDSAQDAPESCTNNATMGRQRTREIGGVRGEFLHYSGGVLTVVVVEVVVVVRVLELRRTNTTAITAPTITATTAASHPLVSIEGRICCSDRRFIFSSFSLPLFFSSRLVFFSSCFGHYSNGFRVPRFVGYLFDLVLFPMQRLI